MTGVRAVSLFSGSGAGDLGLSRAGIGTILQAEPNADCVDVLSVHYPDVFRVPDVRDLATLTPPHECPCECDEPWCERHGDAPEPTSWLEEAGTLAVFQTSIGWRAVSFATTLDASYSKGPDNHSQRTMVLPAPNPEAIDSSRHESASE